MGRQSQADKAVDQVNRSLKAREHPHPKQRPTSKKR